MTALASDVLAADLAADCAVGKDSYVLRACSSWFWLPTLCLAEAIDSESCRILAEILWLLVMLPNAERSLECTELGIIDAVCDRTACARAILLLARRRWLRSSVLDWLWCACC